MAKGEAAASASLIGYLGKATQWGREIWAPGEANGGIPVNLQDQHSPAFAINMSQEVGSATTLTTDATADAWSISVTTGHGLVAGDEVLLQDPTNNRAAVFGVVSTAGNNTVNLDSPLQFSYPAASTIVQELTSDLTVDGSTTRQSFYIRTQTTLELDITCLQFQMTTTAAPEFTDFGDIIGGLTRGLFLRQKINGIYGYNNLWNCKNNADLAQLACDFTIYEETSPPGVNGIAFGIKYAGQHNHGVTLRIGQNDELELIVQDDLTSLLSFHIQVHGHLVTD